MTDGCAQGVLGILLGGLRSGKDGEGLCLGFLERGQGSGKTAEEGEMMRLEGCSREMGLDEARQEKTLLWSE
jgi:hypothetical protein